jgi:3-hydroxyacyl-CoA dehydrogenase
MSSAWTPWPRHQDDGDALPQDPWHAYFKAPAVVQALIAKGALGQKAGAGFFRKVGKDILVLDPAKADYVPQTGKVSDEVRRS